MHITYFTNGEINPIEVVQVFRSVGWPRDVERIREPFEKSFYVMAYDGEKLIGLARAISDYSYYTGIYDVIVMPEYQKQGIGKQMMEIIIEEFKYTHCFLSYTEGNGDFYKSLGFMEMNNTLMRPKNPR